MSNQIDDSGPAFSSGNPTHGWEKGMTLRQYAAIHLKVAESGLDWLDEMIVSSITNDWKTR